MPNKMTPAEAKRSMKRQAELDAQDPKGYAKGGKACKMMKCGGKVKAMKKGGKC